MKTAPMIPGLMGLGRVLLTLIAIPAILAVLAAVGVAEADGEATTITVGEWRQRFPVGTAAFAAGAFIATSWQWDCNVRTTVGEMKAFLLYSAEPDEKLRLAIHKFYSTRGCQFMLRPESQ